MNGGTDPEVIKLLQNIEQNTVSSDGGRITNLASDEPLQFGDSVEFEFIYDDTADEFQFLNNEQEIPIFSVDVADGVIDLDTDIVFEGIAGSPSFSNHNHSEGGLAQIPNTGLVNDSLTVAGNPVSLGGSTSVDHEDLTGIDPADHHARYTDEESQDATAALLVGGVGIGVTYDDPSDNLTINGHERYTDEESQDATNALLTGGVGITLTYDDANDDLTVDGHQRYTDEESQDATNALLTGGTGISLAYDDANNDLTITGHQRYTDEEAQDAVGTILSGDFVYDDATPTIDLANDSVTVTAGDGLKGGGTVALGGSTTVNIEPGDFAGAFLQDDGTDDLEVLIADGLKDNGTGSIAVEPADFAGTFLVDDGADNLQVSIGDGLKNASGVIAVEPADIAGTYLSDDGADNLRVDIGFGIEGDGAGNIQVNEDASFTWTATHTFNGGITAGGNIDLQSTYRVVNAVEPTDPDELARKAYVDGVAQGLNLKDSVRAASTGNIDLTSTTDPNPIDGVTLNNGDRVLLKDQTTGTENGIYVANTATDPSTWTRSEDANADDEVTSGLFTFAEEGTQNGSTSWIITTDDPITLGTTSITFAQFASAGEITAGDGLTKSGQTLDIEPADFAGTFLSDDGSDNLQVDIGNGLKNNGSGAIAVEPADIAGAFISDDGADNLQVNLGDGLEGDGTGSIRVDEDFAFTWTVNQTFAADIVDGAGNTVYDQTNNEILRERLDDDKITSLVSANTTTSNEELIFVDTSGGPVTITLASADVVDGNTIVITDVTGDAATNNITIATEGTETIDGDSSETIVTGYGTVQYTSNGTNWFSSGGGSGGAFIDSDGDSIGELLTSLDGIQLGDDEVVQFGTDEDYTIEYNSTTDRLELIGPTVATSNVVAGNQVNMTDVRM